MTVIGLCRGGGVGANQGGEVFACAGARQHLARLRLQSLHLIVAGAFGHGDQDLGQVDFQLARVRGGLLRLQIGINVGLTHPHPWLQIAFAQALHQDLVAQLGPEHAHRQAIGDDTPMQFSHRELVLRRDRLLGLVDGRLLGPDTGVAGELKQDFLVDQAFQHLGIQALQIGRRTALSGKLLLHPQHFTLKLGVGQRLGIDHRHDVVGSRCAAGGDRRASCGRQAQTLGLQLGTEQSGGQGDR